MYSVQPVQMSNGGIGRGTDVAGTVDPQVLGAPGLAGASSPPVAQQSAQQTPRGQKRTRSPDDAAGDGHPGDADDNQPRKRGRPPKTPHAAAGDSPRRLSQPPTPSSRTSVAPPVQTPQPAYSHLPQTSPPQKTQTPHKGHPGKPPVLKALPTVRDHTTDQLNEEGDEYIPREKDEAGEQKVSALGEPLGGRQYRAKTFKLVDRGDKLFMLATECSRVLGYRDSYLLFNKNKSLYKMIATEAQKTQLIQEDVLPYSYRSRQIAVVSARSIFRQFGSRIVLNGRRVRDDYWESKAKKQGFTEEDAAGEKRPGAAKAREAAAAEAVASQQGFAMHQAGVYPANLDQGYLGSDVNPLHPFGGLLPAPGSVPLDQLDLFPPPQPSPGMPAHDYSGVQRARQEVTGAPYQDTSRPTPSGEILSHATQTAELNKQFAQQRKSRGEYLENVWARPHEPTPPTQRPAPAEGESMPQPSPAVQSTHLPSSNTGALASQFGMGAGTPQRPGPQMPAQSYRTPVHPGMIPPQLAAQHVQMRQEQMQRRPPPMGAMGMPPQGIPAGLPSAGMMPMAHSSLPSQGYAPSPMWNQGQPQPSPLSQQHSIPQQFPQRPPQQSPVAQPSPMHPSAQLHQGAGGMHGASMQQLQGMAGMDPNFQAMAQNQFQANAGAHQFMQQNAHASQPGMTGWSQGAQGQQQQGHQQGWPTF